MALVEEQGEKVVIVDSQAQSEELTWRDIHPDMDDAPENLTPEERLVRAIFGEPLQKTANPEAREEQLSESDPATPLHEILAVQRQLLAATQENGVWLRCLVEMAGEGSAQSAGESQGLTTAGLKQALEKVEGLRRARASKRADDIAEYARQLAREEGTARGNQQTQRREQSDEG
ncbi:MAG: hypothetical protein AAFY75_00980 [Pseudomonadota bacterium]